MDEIQKYNRHIAALQHAITNLEFQHHQIMLHYRHKVKPFLRESRDKQMEAMNLFERKFVIHKELETKRVLLDFFEVRKEKYELDYLYTTEEEDSEASME